MSTELSKFAFSRQEPSDGEERTPSPASARLREAPASEGPGFSGTCENTPLADWIQLVQMGRRDAVISVRHHDGRMARLWCQEGDVIDASCEGLDGEDGVYRALSWEGGRVVVDFRAFARARRIPLTTSALLLEGAFRKDSGIRALRGSVQLNSAPLSAAPASSPQYDWIAISAPVKPARRRRLGVLLGLIAGLAVLVSLWMATSNRSSQGHPGTTEETRAVVTDTPAPARVGPTPNETR